MHLESFERSAIPQWRFRGPMRDTANRKNQKELKFF
jgi:hypothetical protein